MSAHTSIRRGLLGGAVALAAVLAPATAATAQYGPGEEPSIDVQFLEPVCDGDVPWLSYSVSVPEGVGNGTATVTFHHPSDPSQDYVQSGLPLSGRILWPGAETDSAGNPVDWPGWRLENGEWVVGDEWDWVRPSVEVTIEVNPVAGATVAYPPSSPACLTDPPGMAGAVARPPAQAPGGGLPETGTAVLGLVGIGGALAAAGLGMRAVARKRSTSA